MSFVEDSIYSVARAYSVNIGGLEFPAIECAQVPLTQYDLNADAIVDKEDTMLAGVPEGEADAWVLQNYYFASLEECPPNEMPPWRQMQDVISTYQTVRPVRDKINQLRTLPHHDGSADWSGHLMHTFNPSNWRRAVPIIGGTENYERLVEGAADVYRHFVESYDMLNRLIIPLGGVLNTYETTTESFVKLYKLHPSVQPAARQLTTAMSDIANWADAHFIECEGDNCPDDDESSTIYTRFTPDICYVKEENGDAYCHDYVVNPYVHAGCNGLFNLCHATDDRSGESRWGFFSGDNPRLGLENRRPIAGR